MAAARETGSALLEASARTSVCEDVCAIAKLTVPMFLSRVSFVMMKTTDSSILGHTGTRYLEAVALSDLWTSSTGVFIQSGAASMLCSQAYGAGNKKLVGIWIQVAYAVLGIACVFVAIAWSLTGPVLRALGRSEDLAGDAQYFALVLMICLPVRILYSQLSCFFNAQKITKPSMVTSVCGMLANLVFGLIFVLGLGVPNWDGFGFAACPWVTTIVEYAQFALVWSVFCVCLQQHAECWPGWSWEHVTRQRLGVFLKQYIPQTLSLASDFWRVAAIGAVASMLGDENVAVWNTSYRICWMSLTFVGSLSGAMSTQIGLNLGAGRVANAKRQTIIGVMMGVTLLFCLVAIVIAIPREFGMIFSNDPIILDKFEESNLAMAAFVGFMNLSVLIEAIPRIVGKPQMALWLGVVGSWVGQVPCAFLLTKYWRDDLTGLYTGSAVGYALLCVLLLFACLTFDWDELTKEAQIRSETRTAEARNVQAQPHAADGEAANGHSS